MTQRMLIDATHKEETRVAVVSDRNRLEEFDYESASRKQLKGNIYLVKVTRVEPSLQAAFVDFGGNRHGFLPFPEIHPDYYRIPIEDRQALIEEERRLTKEEAAEADARADAEAEEKERRQNRKTGKNKRDGDDTSGSEDENGNGVLVVGGISDDVEEEDVRPSQLKTNIKRRYKIQEVIKRGQVMLIQISKEERGNKGAAVTSYISLPGRYCVLMPNSSRGGGVSRKVTNMKDRKKLKKILSEINIPDGMSVILRTAGVSRSKAEIKRDLDYLLQLWNDIRELTLQSTAPALVHEEGNLIKRAIRDLYRREIDEVLVAGEEGYETAKKLMKSLIPSHARRVKLDKGDTPIFARYHVEHQIDETYSTTVSLRSGGYLVINPTEALVAIDINSGKATKGRHIEETALKTNLEAAEEIARQLRLRDLGGLIVIDFIDMEENRNNRLVERKLKEAMQGDRARIQISRISVFGLLELSRQRLRPSLVESNFMTCEHCSGSGVVRTVESSSVMVLRHIEEELMRGKPKDLIVTVSADVALYLLNKKRRRLHELEGLYDVKIELEVDKTGTNQNFALEVITAAGKRLAVQPPQHEIPLPASSDSGNQNRGGRSEESGSEDDSNNEGGRRKRGGRSGRSRGGRRRRKDRNPEHGREENRETGNEKREDAAVSDKPDNSDKKDIEIKEAAPQQEAQKTDPPADKDKTEDKKAETKEKAPAKKRAPRKKKADSKTDTKKTGSKKEDDAASKPEKSEKAESVTEKPKDDKAADNKVVAIEKSETQAENAADVKQQNETPPEKKKKGWWQKLKE